MKNVTNYRSDLDKVLSFCHQTKRKKSKIYYLHRLLSVPLTILFFRLKISPNFVSFMMVVLSILGSFLMCIDSQEVFCTGFFLCILSFFLDKVDGDLARLYGVDNVKGALLDFVYHRFSLFLFYLCISIHFSSVHQFIIPLGASCGFSQIISKKCNFYLTEYFHINVS